MKFIVIACSTTLLMVASAFSAERPNVLIIMADDLGFSDIGCYGSEIDTPNLDRLADNGLRFSQFYNTAKCHSSRISLLTGQYAHQAGDEAMNHGVTSAEVLRQAGYSTNMVGKWHLDKQPTDFGFDRYWGHLSGACNYFLGDKTFRLNGQPWAIPKDFYTTVANVDFALEFLNEARETKKPWYLYVAFNAPHCPLQPLEADYKKYAGRYDAGWDTIHESRAQKLQELGLFGQEVTASGRPDSIPAWSELTDQQRDWESRRMSAYAGLIDRVDQEIGRLLDDLESRGELDNTLILFVADNGACPYDRPSHGINNEPYLASTSWSDSTGWAWSRNTPFRFYKQNQYEGGIATPGIIHWPAGLATKPGSINHDPVHLIDVLPTVAELAGTKIPSTWPDRDLRPVSGVSFAPILRGEAMSQRPPLHFMFAVDRGLRDGDWKLASFRSEAWELFHIPTDRTERNNVAEENPAIVARLAEQWNQMAAEVLHAPANYRKPVTDFSEKLHREWTRFDRPVGDFAHRAKRNAKATGSIRARKQTTVRIENNQMILTCAGTDAGIAIDRLQLPKNSVGPYSLSFRLKSNASGAGEIYYSTAAKTPLPNGMHLEFDVIHDDQWHNQTLKLNTPGMIHGLRFDPCGGPGTVRIQDLRLLDSNGKQLKQWPK